MIEITFKGGVESVTEEMRRYLNEDEPGKVNPYDDYDFKFVPSNSSTYDQVVTTLGRKAIACTCQWFRHHPTNSAPCRHMKIAQAML
jgi:hypothetical protein